MLCIKTPPLWLLYNDILLNISGPLNFTVFDARSLNKRLFRADGRTLDRKPGICLCFLSGVGAGAFLL